MPHMSSKLHSIEKKLMKFLAYQKAKWLCSVINRDLNLFVNHYLKHKAHV